MRQPFPLTPSAAVLQAAAYRSARLYLVEAMIKKRRKKKLPKASSSRSSSLRNRVREEYPDRIMEGWWRRLPT